MNKAGAAGKILFYIYLAAIHLCLIFLIVDKFHPLFPQQQPETTSVIPLPSPLQLPPEAANFTVADTNQNQTKSNQTILAANQNANVQVEIPRETSGKLMIPVLGIKARDLRDTYTDARSENRVHNAIDIAAPPGTPVVAVADGEIARFFDSELGGVTIYQFSADKKYIYYYAHLQKRADDLQEKVFVPQGKVIGYVGDTGNAGAGNFHLHFSISIPTAPDRYWEGENINPFPLLAGGVEAVAR